jgi:hypothetical protein
MVRGGDRLQPWLPVVASREGPELFFFVDLYLRLGNRATNTALVAVPLVNIIMNFFIK